MCPGCGLVTKERGSPPRGLTLWTEGSLNAWTQRCTEKKKNHCPITNRYCCSVRTLSLTSCIILGPGSARGAGGGWSSLGVAVGHSGCKSH